MIELVSQTTRGFCLTPIPSSNPESYGDGAGHQGGSPIAAEIELTRWRTIARERPEDGVGFTRCDQKGDVEDVVSGNADSQQEWYEEADNHGAKESV